MIKRTKFRNPPSLLILRPAADSINHCGNTARKRGEGLREPDEESDC